MKQIINNKLFDTDKMEFMFKKGILFLDEEYYYRIKRKENNPIIQNLLGEYYYFRVSKVFGFFFSMGQVSEYFVKFSLEKDIEKYKQFFQLD
jgi:hypothetical protein